MPTSRPPRQPDQVRNRLIRAATTLLSKGQVVSIGSVAEFAGVSKGAVQHHFGTREQLFVALNEAYLQEFNSALAAEDTSLPAALRYARLSINAPSGNDAEVRRAMLMANVVERDIASRWSELIEVERAGDDRVSNVHALLIRLAADGLWLSDLLSTYKISDQERVELASLMSELLHQP